MFNSKRLRLAVAALGLALPATAHATTYFKIADEFGTIQPGGARTGATGIRFWNAEGSANGINASTAPFRFHTADIVSQANSEFGVGGWEVTNVNIVFSQSNAFFTAAGNIDLYWFANDSLAITNGENDLGSAEPGHFAQYGVSPLRYQSGANVLDTVVDGETDATAIFGSHVLVDSFQFTSNGNGGDWPLDVLAPATDSGHAIINPEASGIVVGGPSYGIAPPIENPTRPFRSDTEANFTDYANRVQSNLDITAIAADLESAGSDYLSFILVATDPTAAATYKGNPFSGDYPARIYFEIEAKSAPGLAGDVNGDGIVDLLDVNVATSNWDLTPATLAQGDANGDGDVNLLDINVITGNWQATGALASSAAMASAVPEPASVAMLGLAALGLVGCVRRRQG